MCQAKRSGYGELECSCFLHIMYIRNKKNVGIQFIFGILLTGRDSSISPVAFLDFHELK
jgi:hypothetical protein